MAMTLVESSKYSNDVLQRGVIELIVKDDPIMSRLQFKDIKGNGLTYDVETTMSGADFYSVGDTWLESTSTVTQHTAHTKILGGDADVDNYLAATRSDKQDLMAEQIEAKTKAIRHAFLNTLFYGDNATESNRFDGLHQILDDESYNTVAVGGSGAPAVLSMSKIEEILDMILDGKADMLVMTKLMRRSINTYLKSVGGITYSESANGSVQTIQDVPVVVSDFLSNNEACDKDYGSGYGHDPSDGTTLANNDSSTSIFALQFGPKALCGVQSMPVTTEKFKKLETKDAARTRIKWYPSIMVQSVISCAKLTGLQPAGTVTA